MTDTVTVLRFGRGEQCVGGQLQLPRSLRNFLDTFEAIRVVISVAHIDHATMDIVLQRLKRTSLYPYRGQTLVEIRRGRTLVLPLEVRR